MFGLATWTVPAGFFLGFSTTGPTAAGTNVTEPSGGSYARVAVTDWVVDGALVENNVLITFPTATASWGTPTHVVVYDALTSGNYLGSSLISSPVQIKDDDTASLGPGQITFEFASS